MEVIVAAVLGVVGGVAGMWGYMRLRASREREATLRRVDQIGRSLEASRQANQAVARERIDRVQTEADVRALMEDIWR